MRKNCATIAIFQLYSIHDASRGADKSCRGIAFGAFHWVRWKKKNLKNSPEEVRTFRHVARAWRSSKKVDMYEVLAEMGGFGVVTCI